MSHTSPPRSGLIVQEWSGAAEQGADPAAQDSDRLAPSRGLVVGVVAGLVCWSVIIAAALFVIRSG